MRPVRIQLSRRKGFNLQAASKAINGLPAVNVARPSLWGNRYRVGIDGDAAECVEKFRASAVLVEEIIINELRGKNLACWCKIGAPCHAGVLLELANPPKDRRALSAAIAAAQNRCGGV